jgi:hypothetical protein
MSGISGITSPGIGLAQLLSNPASGQSQSGLSSDPSLLNSLVSSGLQTITGGSSSSADASSSSANGTPSDLQAQIQSAITDALQTAEQSGGSDLKGVDYNALVQVLNSNGIDPKTFQSTANSGGSSTPVDSATSGVLSQVLAAVGAASAASDPAGRLLASQDSSQTASDPFSLLDSSSSSSTANGDSLAQFLAMNNDSQSSTDLYSLLAGSQDGNSAATNSLSSFVGSQNNNQDLLGFLYDSGQ